MFPRYFTRLVPVIAAFALSAACYNNYLAVQKNPDFVDNTYRRMGCLPPRYGHSARHEHKLPQNQSVANQTLVQTNHGSDPNSQQVAP
jgi:hypothetical protein